MCANSHLFHDLLSAVMLFISIYGGDYFLTTEASQTYSRTSGNQSSINPINFRFPNCGVRDTTGASLNVYW